MPSAPFAQTPMPRYRCHKEVCALKIAAIIPAPITQRPTIADLEELLNRKDAGVVEIQPDGSVNGFTGAIISPADPAYADFDVDAEYMRKHDPQPGGYYVVYKDGYKSYSPADAFEDGYTLIE